MKLAMIGSRDIYSVEILMLAYSRLSAYHVTEIVSGGARGTDMAAEELAQFENLPVKIFEATPQLTRLHGVIGALFARNQQIVDYCDALIAIRLPGKSSGTDDAIQRIKGSGKPYWVYEVGITLKESSKP